MSETPEVSLRPALGQVATIGTLYSAHTDKFLDQSVFFDAVSAESINSERTPHFRWIATKNNTLTENLEALGMSVDMSASFLGDLVAVGGSAKWLQQSRDAQSASVVCTSMTTYQQLRWDSQEELQELVDRDSLRPEDATHVVCGIHWGARTVVSASKSNASDEIDLKAVITSVGESANVTTNGGSFEPNEDILGSASKAQFKIYTDLPVGSQVSLDYAGVVQYLRKVPETMKKIGGGKGKCLIYDLVPISVFGQRIVNTTLEPLFFRPSTTEDLQCMLEVYNATAAARTKLIENASRAQQHAFCLSQEAIQHASRHVEKAADGERNIRSKLSQKLRSLRSGSMLAAEFHNALLELRSLPDSPEQLMKLASSDSRKMDFADSVRAQGAKYGTKLEVLLNELSSSEKVQDLYVVHYNGAALDLPVWTATWKLLQQLVGNKQVLVIDHDMSTEIQTLEAPYIQHLRDGKVMIPDMVADMEELAGRSLLQCGQPALIAKSPPTIPNAERLEVKIPCPGPMCSSTVARSWMCLTCRDPVFFGAKSKFLYCGCGSFEVSTAQFHCKQESHAESGYAVYADQNRLLDLLKQCVARPEYNILILGETGVGKSTFINSFINYLLYQSLDEAMKAPELEYAIPCSFSYEELVGDKFERYNVEVGKESEVERQSKGGVSATQSSVTYELNFNGQTIRLIDTPGIGDTRGLDQDHRNVKDILQTLESVNQLNAVLFLMKPNAARLTPTFDFCLTELMSHLHKDTKRNIVFGFTNARSTNYTLGDTSAPLEALLAKHNTNIKLGLPTLFFFDSESFRYLAAYKVLGNEMSGKEGFVQSWKKSSEEARRLISTTTKLPAHKVQMTLSMNRTRLFITKMTVPMVETAVAIQTTTDNVNALIRKVEEYKATGKKLEEALTVKLIVSERQELERPSTVCTNASCVTMRPDPTDPTGIQKLTDYSTECHQSCYQDVPEMALAHPNLVGCYAFNNRGEKCINCGHEFGMHFHIKHRYVKVEREMPDEENISKKRGNDKEQQDAESKREELEESLKQIEAEYAQVKTALATFGVYLEQTAMVTYNDATIKYIEYMIKQAEREQREADKERYVLQKDVYIKQLDAITKAIAEKTDTVPTHEDVDRIVLELKGMTLFGKSLTKNMDEGTVVLKARPSVPVDMDKMRKKKRESSWWPLPHFGKKA